MDTLYLSLETKEALAWAIGIYSLIYEVIFSAWRYASDGYKTGGQLRIIDGSSGADLAASNTADDLVEEAEKRLKQHAS